MPLVKTLLQELADFPGVQGCALVDADTGMTWHQAGNLADMEQIGEAAIEFWRVQRRLPACVNTFGRLKSSAHSFGVNVLTLFPCKAEPELVLVCVAVKQAMNWPKWGERLIQLKQALAEGNVQ